MPSRIGQNDLFKTRGRARLDHIAPNGRNDFKIVENTVAVTDSDGVTQKIERGGAIIRHPSNKATAVEDMQMTILTGRIISTIRVPDDVIRL